jgi:hypothetical protein
MSSFVCIFCAFEVVFGGTESVGSCFLILRSRTHFGRYRRHRVPFSWFALPDSFWAESRAPSPVFMFCAPGLVLGGTKGVRSRFQVLRSRTHFRRNRGRRVPFACFALPDPFWAVPMESGLVFIFCAPSPVSGGTEGAESNFHVLCSQTHFGLCRGRRVQLPCFAFPDSFSAESRAPGPIFKFCASGVVFDGIGSFRSRFHVLCS